MAIQIFFIVISRDTPAMALLNWIGFVSLVLVRKEDPKDFIVQISTVMESIKGTISFTSILCGIRRYITRYAIHVHEVLAICTFNLYAL